MMSISAINKSSTNPNLSIRQFRIENHLSGFRIQCIVVREECHFRINAANTHTHHSAMLCMIIITMITPVGSVLIETSERPVQCRAGLARWKSPINTYTQRMHFIFYMMDFMQLFRIECEWCKWCVVLNCMPAIPRVTNCLYARWCCFMCIKGIANTKSKYIVPFHCVECNSVYEGLGRLKRTEQ